jgi:hypothetical protein
VCNTYAFRETLNPKTLKTPNSGHDFRMFTYQTRKIRKLGLVEWLRWYSTCLASVKLWIQTPLQTKLTNK